MFYKQTNLTQQEKADILFKYYHQKQTIPEISKVLNIDEIELKTLFINELYDMPFYYYESKTNSFFRYGPES